MSRKIKILVFVLFTYILFSLLYIYKTNISIVNDINTNNDLRKKITVIQEFKTDIANMSLMSRYYIITGDNKYRIKFEKNLYSALSRLDNLEQAEYITVEDRSLIEKNLNEYNYLTCKDLQKDTTSTDHVSNNIADNLYKLTDIESSLMEDTTDTFLSSIEKTSSNAKATKNIVDTQNNLIQIVGGFFSTILLAPFYFLKKNPTFLTDAIKTFISSHKKKDSTELDKSQSKNITCDDVLLKCINDGVLKNLEEFIAERDKMISTLRIVYSHNKYMKEEWGDAKASLDSIEQDLLNLKKELNILMTKSDIPYEKINLLENKFLEIRFLLEKLPQYHDFIMNILENEYVSK